MKKIVLSIAFLVCQQILLAQSDRSPGFLWQVNINGSEFTLAGSIHAAKKENYPLHNAYIEAYKEADFIIFEIKEDFESIQEQLFTYAENDKLLEDQYLNNFLSPGSMEILALLFKGKERTLQRQFEYEGWLLNMSVMGMTPRMIGFDPELAIDKYFHDLATNDQKIILGLDQIETQFQLFEFEAPLETQINILERGLKTIDMRAKSEQPLFDAYFSQDRDAFEKAFLTPLNFENPQVKAMYDRVFVSRNKAWVQKIIELANKEKGHYFMLVGCGHYFGPENILELLKEEGFNPNNYKI
ncbi:MAG: TraB/GumN family protein [Bacteroides sp.]|jgi:uncharacterized protein YbaP (TraB family)|nr:TraB/GumN family protein [Bacteroides sp.]